MWAHCVGRRRRTNQGQVWQVVAALHSPVGKLAVTGNTQVWHQLSSNGKHQTVKPAAASWCKVYTWVTSVLRPFRSLRVLMLLKKKLRSYEGDGRASRCLIKTFACCSCGAEFSHNGMLFGSVGHDSLFPLWQSLPPPQKDETGTSVCRQQHGRPQQRHPLDATRLPVGGALPQLAGGTHGHHLISNWTDPDEHREQWPDRQYRMTWTLWMN